MSSPQSEEYRAGAMDARLRALEVHAAAVNGTIEATGQALAALTVAVNELRLTIKMLELHELSHRVNELEKSSMSAVRVGVFKRWLFAAVLSSVACFTAVVSVLLHFH